MLDIAYGSVAQRPQVQQLVEALRRLPVTGTLYIGYPVLRIGDEQVPSDALLTTQEHGVVLFDLAPLRTPGADRTQWLAETTERQDDRYRALYNKLLANRELTNRRDLAFKVNVVTFLPTIDDDYTFEATDADHVAGYVATLPPIGEDLFRRLNAAIQRTRNIKPVRRRENVKNENSRAGVLKRIEAEIANLDQWQKAGAIEFPNAPQRIRGLAGSGKTIVLALKAAYLHATNPDWRIGVTFQSRALYQQFEDLIRRFSYDTIDDEPDWTKLQVLHAWGGRADAAVYRNIAVSHGKEPRDYATAKRLWGSNAFEGACAELLEAITSNGATPQTMYEALLIDEAQDFPISFFRLVYAVTEQHKRIIWAYDELQNLGEYAMAPPAELFGLDENGQPRVELRNEENSPKQDIVLPVCYRNTPWALTIAHALGFGIYRPQGLVQMFAETQLWRDVGYEVQDGELELGHHVALKRNTNASPSYFAALLQPEDAVVCAAFNRPLDEARWIANEIRRGIDEDELLPRDFLIILPNVVTAKSESSIIMKALDAVGIRSHLAGVNSSRDVLFMDDSVAMTQIYRAKGNEAPMVFVSNAGYCLDGFALGRKRNTLFTAITRSNAWVRITGTGEQMSQLIAEIESVKRHHYRLDFGYPTAEQIQHLQVIHRDRDDKELEKIGKNLDSFKAVLEDLQSGNMLLEQLPPETRKLVDALTAMLGKTDE